MLLYNVCAQVQADVTEGAEKLALAIGNVETVICATGYNRSLDLFAPWKVIFVLFCFD